VKLNKISLVACCFLASLNASQLELGYGGLKFDYTETSSNGTWLDSETSGYGDLKGGYIKYVHDLGKIWSYEQSVEGYYSFHEGFGAYDGHLQNSITGSLTPYETTTWHEILQMHLRYKIENNVGESRVGWFLGLGNRAWDRDIQGPFGLLEEYEWNYGEIGLSGTWYENGFFTGFELSYQEALNPTMKAHINGGLDFDLGKTNGYKVRIPFGYNIDKAWSVSLNYVLDVWEIEQSNVVGGFVEPASETKNSYAYVALSYNF
jgi:hypothetical protein